jgi:hypothetical protein
MIRKEPRWYDYRLPEGLAVWSMQAHSPTDCADSVFSCVRISEVWVRLVGNGNKWVLYRLVNGKARRAKSLRVGV